MDNNLSLYIHYPYCKHLCNYCDFYKKPLSEKVDYSVLEKGLEKNLRDVRNLAAAHGQKVEGALDTVYLGGGTPSLWGIEGARFLKDFLKEEGVFTGADCEFTIEADPGSWTEEGLAAWKETGANRFSVGVQSFNEEFLKIMDRAHDLDEVKKTLERFKKGGESFSADLMLGLPYSRKKKRNILKELKNILEYGPNHISVYILKTRANYPHNAALPEDEYIEEEYLKTSEFLKEQGFDHYEVSNFARPGSESKHNFKYWEAKTVHALGPNATGFMQVDKEKAFRYQHKPSGEGLTEERLGREELKLESVYLGLRTNKGLDLAKYFGSAKAKGLIERWSSLGYLENLDEDRTTLNSKGYLMIDSMMDDLFVKGLL